MAKKSSKAQVIKELKLSPKISDHDFNVRLNQGIKFLGKSYIVKLSVFFKGREIAHMDLGKVMLDRYIEEIKEYGSPSTDITRGQRSLFLIIKPVK